MFKNLFKNNSVDVENKQREENRRKSLNSYNLTEQLAVQEAVKDLLIDPAYLERCRWDMPVNQVDVVSMAFLAGKYPLCFSAIRKLYTGEQTVSGIDWTSNEDRLQKLEIVKQRLKMMDEQWANRLKENPKLINELNEIDWGNLPHQLQGQGINNVIKYASAYKFRFPEYAYAYTGVRFPCPREGQTFEEAWREKELADQEKPKETVRKRGR